jgi:hypothetical protein
MDQSYAHPLDAAPDPPMRKRSKSCAQQVRQGVHQHETAMHGGKPKTKLRLKKKG